MGETDMSRCFKVAAAIMLAAGIPASGLAEEWTPITDVEEIRSMVTDRTMVMYQTRQQYHRRDGNMVEYFGENQSYIVRKWKLRDDGKFCWMIFTIPDRVVDCAAIQRGPDGKLRYKWENAQGAPPLEHLEPTPASLIEALEEKAGKPE